MAEENTAIELERGAPGGKSSAMGELPFAVAPEASAALAAFSAPSSSSSSSAGAVALCLVDEVVTLLQSASFSAEQVATAGEGGGGGGGGGLLSSALFPGGFSDQAAFVLLRLLPEKEEEKGKVVFVYACPEEAPVKMKMVHSTAKSAVVTLVGGAATIQRMEEVRTAEELDALILPVAAASGGAASALKADEAAIAKPRARGRKGTAKVKKFVADDDE